MCLRGKSRVSNIIRRERATARTKQVHVLIDGVALNSGETELFDELSAQVFDVDLLGTYLQCLLLCRLKVLFPSSQH